MKNIRTHLRKAAGRGDTIVEVMIAMAVISSVLAGAFSVTQKSSQAVRSSQERSEMLQIVQGQLELVRAEAMTAQNMSNPIYSGTTFCINEATATVQPISDLSNYPPACTGRGPGELYSVNIRYISAEESFRVEGTWDGLSGARNTVALSYRIAPGGVVTP